MYMHQYLHVDMEEYKRRKRRKWRSTCTVLRLGKGDSKIVEHLMISKSGTSYKYSRRIGSCGKTVLEKELKKLDIKKEVPVVTEYN